MIELDGQMLTPEAVETVAHGASVVLAAAARRRVEAAHAVVDNIVRNQRPVYGVSTGVDKLCTVPIPALQAAQLQKNIIRSHAAGVGTPLPEAAVRAMMVLRANALACGYSGVRPVVIDTLVEMIGRGVHPLIPAQGSLGASGDLAPLAHLALVVIGEGEAIYQGTQMPGDAAMIRAGVPPLVLGPKEGLALIKGTQLMTALGVLFLLAAERLVAQADIAGALSLEGLRGTDRAFLACLHAARPASGATPEPRAHPEPVGRERQDRPRRLRTGSGRLLAPMHAAGARRGPSGIGASPGRHCH